MLYWGISGCIWFFGFSSFVLVLAFSFDFQKTENMKVRIVC